MIYIKERTRSSEKTNYTQLDLGKEAPACHCHQLLYQPTKVGSSRVGRLEAGLLLSSVRAEELYDALI